MAFEVCSTEAFENDVGSAISYILNDLGAPQAAQRLMQDVDNTVELLDLILFLMLFRSAFLMSEATVKRLYRTMSLCIALKKRA